MTGHELSLGYRVGDTEYPSKDLSVYKVERKGIDYGIEEWIVTAHSEEEAKCIVIAESDQILTLDELYAVEIKKLRVKSIISHSSYRE